MAGPSQQRSRPLDFFTPSLFAIGALYNPAAISLSWLAGDVLSNLQRVGSKAALKLEGLDVEAIDQKNERIRKKMEEMMPKDMEGFAQAPFQVMNVNFDSKTG